MTAPSIRREAEALPEAVPGETVEPHIVHARASSPDQEAVPAPQPPLVERLALLGARLDKATSGPHFADQYHPTIREHWQHHASHAARYPAGIAGPRYAYGAFVCSLDFLWEHLVREWILRYPSRAFGLLALAVILWFCLH